MKMKRRNAICIFGLLIIALSVVVLVVLKKNDNIKIGTEKIDIGDYSKLSRIGREYLLYLKDISDANDGSILAEEVDINILPVYKKKNYVKSEDGKFSFTMSLSCERVERIAKEIGEKIGSGVKNIEYTYYKDCYNYSSVRETKLNEQMQNIASANITFENEVCALVYNNGKIILGNINDAVPGKYPGCFGDLCWGDKLISDEEAGNVLKYLADKYGAYVEMKSPTYCYYSGSSYSHRYIGYEDSGTIRERIVNHDLNYIDFYFDEYDGVCRDITLFNAWEYVDYIGDYPIISVDKATKLLLLGEYITDSPQEYLCFMSIKDADIKRITINYVNVRGYYIPVYKFYVDITEGRDKYIAQTKYVDDLDEDYKVYGVLYVPAIEDTYLNGYN